MEIQPSYLTLQKLLEHRMFRIPEYQRAYSWEDKQRDDLFSDIEKLAAQPDRVHFMATVVCLKTGIRTVPEVGQGIASCQ